MASLQMSDNKDVKIINKIKSGEDYSVLMKERIFKGGNADGKILDLIRKWKCVCKEAIRELKLLKEQSNGEKITIENLLSHFGIEKSFLRYDEEIDDFVDD